MAGTGARETERRDSFPGRGTKGIGSRIRAQWEADTLSRSLLALLQDFPPPGPGTIFSITSVFSPGIRLYLKMRIFEEFP
jgi:hypothetical protein